MAPAASGLAVGQAPATPIVDGQRKENPDSPERSQN